MLQICYKTSVACTLPSTSIFQLISHLDFHPLFTAVKLVRATRTSGCLAAVRTFQSVKQ